MKSISLNNSPTEQSLKDLLEERSGSTTALTLQAEVTLRIYKDLEGISYDELMMLAKENQEILEHMTPLDIAYNTLLTNRNNFYKVAGALNDLKSMGRHDHLLPVHAMVSVNNITVEANFWIPKLNYRNGDRATIIQNHINAKIGSSPQWRNSFRNTTNVDFVEL